MDPKDADGMEKSVDPDQTLTYQKISKKSLCISFRLRVPDMKIFKLANIIDLDQAAHHEPPQLDLHS